MRIDGKKRVECIACNSGNLYKVFDLGVVPSANNLVKKASIKLVKSYPLNYYWCKECGLLQQVKLVDSKKLFRKYYVYITGASKNTVNLFRKEAELLKRSIKNKDLAYVIASNDGTEIKLIKNIAGFKEVIGIEPAINIAKYANKLGLKTVNDFFTWDLSNKLLKKYGKADLIVANNVFAHIPYPRDMLNGMKNLLKEDGVIEIEVHWLKSLVESLQIDILYAEHYYEWSIKAMVSIAHICGLELVSAESLPTQQGGSIRFWLKLSGKQVGLNELISKEREIGVYNQDIMLNLQNLAEGRKIHLISIINDIKKQNKTIGIWSVPAKIVTILNFCGLTNRDIDCAFDIAKTKINRYIPKANILIKDKKVALKNVSKLPDYLIIVAWNYIDENKKELKEYLRRGGKLINPLSYEIISK